MKAEPLYYVAPISGLLATSKQRADAAETTLLAALAAVLLAAALLGYLTPPGAAPTSGATPTKTAALVAAGK